MTATIPTVTGPANEGDCATVGCSESAHTRGHCQRHYRYRLHTGRYGYRDVGRARAHVKALRSLGWTYVQIGEAAGVSAWVAQNLDSGKTRWLWADREAAILAVPLELVDSHRGVDGTGTYRRLEALQRMGWPLAEIAGRIGLKPYTLTTLRSRGEPVSWRVALAMRTVYDELSLKQGPSKQTATKARRRGYESPLAWDDDTIDDPTAVPQRGGLELTSVDEVVVRRVVEGRASAAGLTRPERGEAARLLAAKGLGANTIARRLHCSYATVVKILEAS